MVVVLVLIFSLVALGAAAFVVLPFLRAASEAGETKSRRPWMAAIAGLVTMALGLGVYAVLGQPAIALSSLTGPSQTDYPALITMLARRMPDRPGDIEGWTLLGRGYLSLGNAAQAEKALSRAVAIAKDTQGFAPPQLLSSYGEAMAEASGGVARRLKPSSARFWRKIPKTSWGAITWAWRSPSAARRTPRSNSGKGFSPTRPPIRPGVARCWTRWRR